MSGLTRDDVAHLAHLARIDLSDAELDTMVGELGVILDSVATVQQAPTGEVEPMSHPMPLVNVTRADVVEAIWPIAARRTGSVVSLSRASIAAPMSMRIACNTDTSAS